MSSDSIVSVVEVQDGAVDADGLSEAGQGARNARQNTLASFPALGPPDLVYTVKRYRGLVGAPTYAGYYHFVRGVDVSSGGAVSAYVVSLINAGLTPAAWYSGGGYTLHSVEFRTYNALSKVDVVASVSLPGGLNAVAVDASGASHPMTDELWAETAISAAARAALSVGEAPLYPALRVFQPFPGSLAEEGALLASAVSTVRRWPFAGSARPGLTVGLAEPPVQVDSGSEFSTRVTPADSRIAAALSQHFEDFSRYDPAVAFFANDKHFPLRVRRPAMVRGRGAEEADTPPSDEPSRVPDRENGDAPAEVDADLAEMRLFAASAQLAKGDVSAARATLDAILEAVPGSSAAWALSSRVRLCAGDVTGAIRDGIAGANARPADALAWVTLADCLAIAGRHGDALRALNAAELPPPELDPFLRSLLPGRRRTTSASVASTPGHSDHGGDGSDGARIFATRLREEKNDRGAASGAAGASGVDEMLAELPAKLMTDGERAVCAVLVRILDAIGWDALLMVRSDCFVMEADTAREGGADGGAEGASSPVVSATPESAVAVQCGETPVNGAVTDAPGDANSAAAAPASPKTSNPPGDGGADDHAVGARSPGSPPGTDSTPQFTPVGAVGIAEDGDGSGAPADGPSSTAAPKAVCKTWLDYLVSSMYEDLRALAVWSAEEAAAARALAASANAAAANGAARSPAPAGASEDADVEASGGTSTPAASGADGSTGSMNVVRTAEDTAAATKRPAADWLRRAQLAARFSRAADAARAYEVVTILASKGDFPALTAWCARMASAAEEGDATLTIEAAVAVTVTADGLRSAAVSSAAGGGAANTGGGGSGSGTTSTDVSSTTSGAFAPPIAVRRALYRLVSKIGLRRVREVANKSAGARVGPRLQSVLLDAVEWHVEGFDR